MLFYQIGLGSSAEFAYLASRDRSCYERSAPEQCRFPSEVAGKAQRWSGVLIEAHPYAFVEAFQQVQHRIPDAMEQLEWVLGALWVEAGVLPFTAMHILQHHWGWSQPNVEHDGYAKHHPDESLGMPTIGFNVASITPEQVIDAFGEPDLIIMDLEGAEVPLLRRFLELLPTCNAYQIESHCQADTESVQELFKAERFEIRNAWPLGNNRMEMQVVR